MIQANNDNNNDNISVKIGRFNAGVTDYTVPQGTDVKRLLEIAGIVLQNNENIFCGAVQCNNDDEVENGDMFQIVGAKEGGKNQ